MFKTVPEKNFFQNWNISTTPENRVGMGYPVLGLRAKSFLQTCGNHLVKNIPNDNTTIFYNIYAYNILLIHYNIKINPEHRNFGIKDLRKNVQLKFMAVNDSVTRTFM
jgi:hypothetical protein